jgi:hypothetical protein
LTVGIRADLRTYLAGSAAITAIVGSAPARIYAVRRPQASALPAIVLRCTGAVHDQHLKESAGRCVRTFELLCCGRKIADCETLAEAVRNRLNDFAGALGSTTVTSTVLVNEEDDFEEDELGGDEGTTVIALDYRLTYRESIPDHT